MREALGQPVPEPAAPVPSTVDYSWAAAEDEVREIIPPRFVENTSEQEAPADDELADYLRSRSML
jgi:hypothetical protein